jgi:hypothetical protein
MYKLLFIFFMFVSSPLYSNEFTFHCEESDGFTMVYDVNLTEKSIVHTFSIFKYNNTVTKVDKYLEVFFWDEKYNSVWTIDYSDEKNTIPSISSKLFNFRHQTLQLQSMRNDVTSNKSVPEISLFGRNRTFECYTMK